jgi:hypothetical protein
MMIHGILTMKYWDLIIKHGNITLTNSKKKHQNMGSSPNKKDASAPVRLLS